MSKENPMLTKKRYDSAEEKDGRFPAIDSRPHQGQQ